MAVPYRRPRYPTQPSRAPYNPRRRPGTPRRGAPYNPFPNGSPGYNRWARDMRGRVPSGLIIRLIAQSYLNQLPDGNNQNPDGYELCCTNSVWDCGSVPTSNYSYNVIYGTATGGCSPPATQCSTGIWPCALGGGTYDDIGSIPAGAGGRPWQIIKNRESNGVPQLQRQGVELWRRIGGAGQPVPIPFVPVYEPSPTPVTDPDLTPSPFDPDPIPSSDPWRNPFGYPPLINEPLPDPVPFPEIPNRPQPNPFPIPGTDPHGSQGTAPRPLPPLGVELFPNPTTRTRQRHALRRPGRGVKERKLIGNFVPGSIPARIVSGITEANDFVNCLHEALPASSRARTGTMQARAAAIYRNFQHMDVAKAFSGCMANQIEDFFYGQIGKLEARVNRRLGLTGGTIGRTSGNLRRATK